MPVRVWYSARRVFHHTHIFSGQSDAVPQVECWKSMIQHCTVPPWHSLFPHPTCWFYPIAQISCPSTGRLGGGRSTEEGKRKKEKKGKREPKEAPKKQRCRTEAIRILVYVNPCLGFRYFQLARRLKCTLNLWSLNLQRRCFAKVRDSYLHLDGDRNSVLL